MQIDLAFTKIHKTPKKNPSNRYAFGLCILHSYAYAFGGRNLAYMPKESGYANRDHGFSVPPRGLFSSVRAVSLFAPPPLRAIGEASRVLLRQLRARAWTKQRTIGRRSA